MLLYPDMRDHMMGTADYLAFPLNQTRHATTGFVTKNVRVLLRLTAFPNRVQSVLQKTMTFLSDTSLTL
jgi:hypothetical protein